MEDTIVHYIDLRDGEDYVWYADCNIVGLSRRIKGDQEAICRALNALQDEWRQTVLHAVS